GLRHGWPSRQQPRHRAPAWRNRHRQGDDPQGHPLQQPPQRQTLHPRQLRRAHRHPAPIPALQPRQRHPHRRHPRQHEPSRLRRISREMLNILLRYPWPGNVRELENAIERAVVLSTTEDFTEDLLPLSVRMFAAQRRTNHASESIETLARRMADQAISDYEMREGEIYQLVMDQIEKALIDRALAKCDGVKTKAADFLGINRNTLNKKVKDLGIEAVD